MIQVLLVFIVFLLIGGLLSRGNASSSSSSPTTIQDAHGRIWTIPPSIPDFAFKTPSGAIDNPAEAKYYVDSVDEQLRLLRALPLDQIQEPVLTNGQRTIRFFGRGGMLFSFSFLAGLVVFAFMLIRARIDQLSERNELIQHGYTYYTRADATPFWGNPDRTSHIFHMVMYSCCGSLLAITVFCLIALIAARTNKRLKLHNRWQQHNAKREILEQGTRLGRERLNEEIMYEREIGRNAPLPHTI